MKIEATVSKNRVELLVEERAYWENFGGNALYAFGACVVVTAVWGYFAPPRPESVGFWALWFFGLALPAAVFAASGTAYIWAGLLLDFEKRRARLKK